MVAKGGRVQSRLEDRQGGVQRRRRKNPRMQKVQLEERVWGLIAPNINSRILTFACTAFVKDRTQTSSRWSKVNETAPWIP